MRKSKEYFRSAILVVIALFIVNQGFAQQTGSLENLALYEGLKKFELQGSARVEELVLKRDRAEMEFTGDFYFAAPINGRITGAVFIGQGTFRAPTPPIKFEEENLIRLIGEDSAESDFRSAVLRFSDDTMDIIGQRIKIDAAVPNEAVDLAQNLEPRLLKETGANISARLCVSLANHESPGFFMAQFDKGRRDRFTYMVDYQARVPTSTFGINGGEKVVLFRYAPSSYANDIWIATYSEEDFKRGRVNFSDEFDLVSPLHYKMEVDLRDARKILRTKIRIDFESGIDNLRALPMTINENLPEYDNIRLKESMRMESARYNGNDLAYIQEDWESGITLLLPAPMMKGEKFSVEVSLAGDFIDNQRRFNVFYPLSNTCWYPRHGYLKRSTFEMIFRHRKAHLVASAGKLVREDIWPDTRDERLTEYRIDIPVSFVTFAAGGLERHTEKRKLEFGEMPIDFYAPLSPVKEEFMLAELGNALNYFSHFFGPYPYENFRAALHPFQFGQGLPTMLLLPKADSANRKVYAFIAHETAHQWWGNIVAWRSYRDQWLSEGFAEYSGMLYTWERDSLKSMVDEIKEARYVLRYPPKTDTGVGEGKVAELGPLILGRRLASRHSSNAYQALIYNKGALVLRMLHFLFTDSSTGKGDLFFNMMKDFVERYENKAATTEDFQQVANEHFAVTPVAKTFGLKDLNWFFRQWVYEAKLPDYRMEYSIQSGENGQIILSGNIIQKNAGEDWFMPLPVELKFPGDQKANVMVYANGPKTSFQFPLPMKPSSVELDPDYWILTENTDTDKK